MSINKKYNKFVSESIDAVDDGSSVYEERLKILVDMALPLIKEVEKLYPLAKKYKKGSELSRSITMAWTRCFKKREKPLEPKPKPKPSITPRTPGTTIREETPMRKPTQSGHNQTADIVLGQQYTYTPDMKCHPYMWQLHQGKQVTLVNIDHRKFKNRELCDSPNTEGCDYLIRVASTDMGLVMSHFTLWTRKECLKPPNRSFMSGWGW